MGEKKSNKALAVHEQVFGNQKLEYTVRSQVEGMVWIMEAEQGSEKRKMPVSIWREGLLGLEE